MRTHFLKGLFNKVGTVSRTTPTRARAAEIAGAALGPVPEALEVRRLLAVTVTQNTTTNTLIVTGTSGNDEIYVYQNNGTPDQIWVRDDVASVDWGPYNVDADLTSVLVNAGGGGDVVLIEGGSSGIIFGGEAVSVPAEIHGEAGNDSLYGGDHEDIIYGEGGTDEMVGYDGNDDMFGGDDADTVWGLQGDDTLSGGAGNDDMIGDEGADAMYGDAGGDHMVGGSENDNIWGDDVSGSVSGDDVIIAGSGDDTVHGGYGADSIRGDEDDDQLYGDYTATDTLNGGNDTLIGGMGMDGMYGGYGDDTLDGLTGELSPGEADVLDGGAGTDSASTFGGDSTFNIP
jgi:Ca2+-binding RTX toxin-like protein